MSDTQLAKDKLLRDFNEVVSDTEQLLKSVASTGGEKTQALRASLEHNLKATREYLRRIEEGALESTRATVRATDEYVHVHPWQSIAVGASLGALVGIVIGLQVGRR